MANTEDSENTEKKVPFTINEEFLNSQDNIELNDTTDYFAHINNVDYVTFFSQVLYCRKELVQYSYPNELFEDADVVADHVNRCLRILFLKILSVLHNTTDEGGVYALSNDIKKIKSEEKEREIRPLLVPIIEKFEEEVRVEFIDLDVDLIFIPDYPGE